MTPNPYEPTRLTHTRTRFSWPAVGGACATIFLAVPLVAYSVLALAMWIYGLANLPPGASWSDIETIGTNISLWVVMIFSGWLALRWAARTLTRAFQMRVSIDGGHGAGVGRDDGGNGST